jgi:hypothetical protein
MSTAKHSPGPWKAHPIEKSRGLPYVPVSAETLIAKVYSKYFGDDEQAAANGRLIAAAPELLSLLRDAVDSFGPDLEGGDDEWLKFARAAIAQATGA